MEIPAVFRHNEEKRLGEFAMKTRILTDSALHLFRAALIRREKTPATIDKYMRFKNEITMERSW